MSEAAPKQSFHDGYKAVFRLRLERGETVRALVERYLRDWLRARRSRDGAALDDWDGESETTLPGGVRITATHYDDPRSGSTGVRYRVYDPSPEGTHRVTLTGMWDRGWRTPEAAFVVTVARDSGTESDAVLGIAPPRLVEQLLEQRRVFDGDTRLQGRPHTIYPGDVGQVVDAIADQKRQVTLVLASSPGAEADPAWRTVVEKLTRNGLGVTGIFVVRADAVDRLNDELPDALKTPRGHIRLVAPRVVFDNPDARRHPLLAPEELADMLEESGYPARSAVEAFPLEPRKLLLGAALPADLRRIYNLLDREERRQDLDREVASELATQAAQQPELAHASSVPAAKGHAAFPRRREHHRRREDGPDFWARFRLLLAGWLETDAASIKDDQVEDRLEELDLRIRTERESLEVQDQFLSKSEDEVADLRVQVAEMREETDSLSTQLGKARLALEAATARADKMEAELALLGRGDAPLTGGDAKAHRAAGEEDLAALEAKMPDAGGRPKKATSPAPRSPAPTAAGEPLPPRDAVDEALIFMANRLEPLIAERLRPYLDGQPRTAILEQLDRARGRRPAEYRALDPAAQLRIITERLGKLGYPFDRPGERTVSSIGQPLRELRKRWAHPDALSQWDALRAYDQLHQLLKELGDTQGADAAADVRDQMVPSLQGPSPTESQTTRRVADKPGTHQPSSPEEVSAELPGPILVRTDGESTPLIGDARPLFEPWETAERQDPAYLDELWRRTAQQRVRSVAAEVVEFEGPVQLERLLVLIAREFGYRILYPARALALEKQVRSADVFVDADRFVWPASIDPRHWTEFRPTPPGSERDLTAISPVEIRNAANFLRSQQPGLAREDLERELLRVFDRKRRTKLAVEHLRKALRD